MGVETHPCAEVHASRVQASPSPGRGLIDGRLLGGVDRENHMEALELTRELLRFDTVNRRAESARVPNAWASCSRTPASPCAPTSIAPGRTSLIARLGGSSDRAPLCFVGHIDTVPLGAMPWTHDPFAGEMADGRLYGRGSTDMKSGVAAFVVAACRLAGRLRSTPGLELVIVAGEENGLRRVATSHSPWTAHSVGRAPSSWPSRPVSTPASVTRARYGSTGGRPA
jgi:hypothetical protein